MKTWKYIACAALLALAGCSAAPTEKQTEDKTVQESANTIEEKDGTQDAAKDSAVSDSASKDAASSDSLKTAGETLSRGLKDAGFTVTDYEASPREISFDAFSTTSDMGVDIEAQANARSAYDRIVSDSDVERQDEFSKGQMTLSVLKNWEEGTYEIAAVDEASGLVYEIDDIQESDLNTVKNAMGQLGFQIA